MITVDIKTPPEPFLKLIRIDLTVVDGIVPVTTPYDIVYTMDGSAPQVDGNGLPLGTAKKRRSPIRQIPIDHPTTLKVFARTPNGSNTTDTQSTYLDVQEKLANQEIHTADPSVRNYTLAVARGDILKTTNGLYGIVFGADKTKQDIREVILVENVPRNRSAGNRTLPLFGSALSRLIGQSLPFGFAQGQIQSTVFEALTFLIELQLSERVPVDEQIDSILSVNVQALDPTSFRYTFSVKTVSGRTVTDSGVIGG